MKNYCLVRSNEQIKVAVQHQFKKLGWTITQLSEDTGIPAYRLGSYLNKDFSDARTTLTQKQLLLLCELLGIKVSITITLDESWNLTT